MDATSFAGKACKGRFAVLSVGHLCGLDAEQVGQGGEPLSMMAHSK